MKLSINQKIALNALKKYPDAIIMDDGWLTGGVGIRLHMSTVNSLKKHGFINSRGDRANRISESGKAVQL